MSAALTVTTYSLCVPGFAISLLSLVFSSLPLCMYLYMVKMVFLRCVCYAIIRKVIILSHVHPCKCYHFFWLLLSKASVWSCGLLMVSAYVPFAYYYFQHSASLHLDTDSLHLKSFLRTTDRTLLTR